MKVTIKLEGFNYFSLEEKEFTLELVDSTPEEAVALIEGMLIGSIGSELAEEAQKFLEETHEEMKPDGVEIETLE